MCSLIDIRSQTVLINQPTPAPAPVQRPPAPALTDPVLECDGDGEILVVLTTSDQTVITAPHRGEVVAEWSQCKPSCP